MTHLKIRVTPKQAKEWVRTVNVESFSKKFNLRRSKGISRQTTPATRKPRQVV